MSPGSEVKGLRRLRQDRAGIAHVRIEVRGRALRRAGQQGARMQQHDWVVVHIDDLGIGDHRLCDLVGTVRRRQPGPNVEELPDPGLAGQVTHGAPEERTVRPDPGNDRRVRRDRLLSGLPVGGEIVLPAEPVVVDAGRMRNAGVEVRGRTRFALISAVGHGSFP
jgi:hypothetical protein